MGLPSGTRLGPYVLDSLIGEGGMGEVYRAHDARLNRTVAIKVLSSRIASPIASSGSAKKRVPPQPSTIRTS